MSHFYGTLQGNRGEATRCGSAGSGMRTFCAGWGGAIRADAYEKDGVDMYSVHLTPWRSSGGASILLAAGLLNSSQADNEDVSIEPWARDLFDTWLPEVSNRKTLEWMARKIARAQYDFGD